MSRNGIVVLLIGCLLTIAMSATVSASGKAKGYGVLTSVESDGSLIIREDKGRSMGYLLSPSAIIQNARKEYISLKNLLPSRSIYFEYEYAREGFMITLIREVPK